MHCVGGLLQKNSVKAVVLLVWLGMLSAGIHGTSQMRVDADVNDFIPTGSYLRDFFDTTREQFGETGTRIDLYWVNDAQVCRTHSRMHLYSACIAYQVASIVSGLFPGTF